MEPKGNPPPVTVREGYFCCCCNFPAVENGTSGPVSTQLPNRVFRFAGHPSLSGRLVFVLFFARCTRVLLLWWLVTRMVIFRYYNSSSTTVVYTRVTSNALFPQEVTVISYRIRSFVGLVVYEP